MHILSKFLANTAFCHYSFYKSLFGYYQWFFSRQKQLQQRKEKLMKEIFAFICIVFSLSACSENSDLELSKLILGKWRAEYKGDIRFVGEGEYKEGGVFVGWGKAYFPDGSTKESVFYDLWEIKDNNLIIRESSDSSNVLSADEIISIDNKEMILLNPKGEKLIRKRIR